MEKTKSFFNNNGLHNILQRLEPNDFISTGTSSRYWVNNLTFMIWYLPVLFSKKYIIQFLSVPVIVLVNFRYHIDFLH